MSETSAPKEPLPLFRIGEVLTEPDAAASPLWHAKRTIAQWALEYLCKGSENLGRAGPVCPWTRPAIDLDTFWLCSMPQSDAHDPTLNCNVASLAERFATLVPQSGPKTQFKTIVVVLPNLTHGSDVELIHQALKPHFLRNGLMLGEFHATCTKHGLHAHQFLPLRSPLPLLVVREMIEFDIFFLAENIDFAELYLKRHGTRGLRFIHRILQGGTQVALEDTPMGNLKCLHERYELPSS